MHIGLIGGIGPAATDYYYRGLIAAAASASKDLDLTIVHADTPTLLGNMMRDDQAAQVAIYQRLTNRLAAAGAGCVVITSIAGHFCIDRFAETSTLPVIGLPEAVSTHLSRQGIERIGVLGTGRVMSSGMYGKLPSVEVIPHETEVEAQVHEAYVALARSGVSTPGLRAVFDGAARTLIEKGAEAILLGGTDLVAAYPQGAEFPTVDCAGVHVAEIARHL